MESFNKSSSITNKEASRPTYRGGRSHPQGILIYPDIPAQIPHCVPTVAVVDFSSDAVTGAAAVDGHAVFKLSIATGGLHMAPSRSLAPVFDQDDYVSRLLLELGCRVGRNSTLAPSRPFLKCPAAHAAHPEHY